MISSWCNSNINIGTIDYSTDHQCKISHSQKCNYQRKGNKKQGNEKKIKEEDKEDLSICFSGSLFLICLLFLFISFFIYRSKQGNLWQLFYKSSHKLFLSSWGHKNITGGLFREKRLRPKGRWSYFEQISTTTKSYWNKL